MKEKEKTKKVNLSKEQKRELKIKKRNEYLNKKAISDKEWNNIQQRGFEELNALNDSNEEFSSEHHKDSELFS